MLLHGWHFFVYYFVTVARKNIISVLTRKFLCYAELMNEKERNKKEIKKRCLLNFRKLTGCLL